MGSAVSLGSLQLLVVSLEDLKWHNWVKLLIMFKNVLLGLEETKVTKKQKAIGVFMFVELWLHTFWQIRNELCLLYLTQHWITVV
jgi:hypothetical protein